MRLAASSVLAWLAALALILASLRAGGEPLSRADLFGFGSTSLALTLLLVALLYLPGLWLLKRLLGGTRPAAAFPAAAALALNAPAYLLLARVAGRTMVREEAITFALAIFAAGAVFGAGYVWAGRGPRRKFLKPARASVRSHTRD